MEPIDALSYRGYARVDFRHDRAALVVIVDLVDGGWELRVVGYISERIDREPTSISDTTWFDTRREAADRACEVIAEVGAIADRAERGDLIAA